MAVTKQLYKKTIIVFLISLSLILCLYRLVSLWNRNFPDFETFYFATHALTVGLNPFNNQFSQTFFISPIFTCLFYLPFVFLPLKVAGNIFLLVSFMSLITFTYVCLSLVNKLSLVSFFTVLILVNLSFPVKFTLGMGQANLIACLLALLSFKYSLKNKQILAGLFISLAIVIKPVLGFIMIFYLLKKNWGIIIGSSAVIAFLTFLTSAVFGFKFYLDYVSIVQRVSKPWLVEPYYNQGIRAFVSRFISNQETGKSTVVFLDLLLVFYLALANFIKSIPSRNLFSQTLIILNLIDPISWQHHFVFLLFPFIFIFFEMTKFKEKKYLFFTLLAISYLLISFNLTNPQAFRGFFGLVVQSHAFFGSLILLFLNSYLILIKNEI